MHDAPPPVLLENGIKITFVDQSNRYFGDYHRLCVLIRIADTSDQTGKTVLERTLEKMGVSTDRLATERQALIESFLNASRGYLEKADFPAQLKKRVLTEQSKPVFLRNL